MLSFACLAAERLPRLSMTYLAKFWLNSLACSKMFIILAIISMLHLPCKLASTAPAAMTMVLSMSMCFVQITVSFPCPPSNSMPPRSSRGGW